MKQRLNFGRRQPSLEGVRDNFERICKEVNDFYSDLEVEIDGKTWTFTDLIHWLQDELNGSRNMDAIKKYVGEFEAELRLQRGEVYKYRLCSMVQIWICLIDNE